MKDDKVDNKLIKKIQEYVESECKKQGSVYGYGPYIEHFLPMVEYSKILQNKIGGILEVIVIAAWLHDIGSIVYGRKDHHIKSKEIANKILAKEKYDKEKMTLVLDCILNHRQSTDIERNTIEEKIIGDADAICNFDMIPGLFYASMVVEKLTAIEAAKSIMKKLDRKWQRLHFDESKKLIEPKYKAASLILSKYLEM